MIASELRRASPHNVLQAWQDGEISYRDAMTLLDIDTLPDLYQACVSSSVPLRKELTEIEERSVRTALEDILA